MARNKRISSLENLELVDKVEIDKTWMGATAIFFWDKRVLHVQLEIWHYSNRIILENEYTTISKFRQFLDSVHLGNFLESALGFDPRDKHLRRLILDMDLAIENSDKLTRFNRENGAIGPE